MTQFALMIYFTWGGRTQKVAEAIGKSLINYDITYFGIRMTGMTQLDQFEKQNFSSIADQLETLDTQKYDLIFFGMPTYGNLPPKAFDEIISKTKHLEGKKVVVFATSRVTRGTVVGMKTKIEARGATVVDQCTFKGMFHINLKLAAEFGGKINQMTM